MKVEREILAKRDRGEPAVDPRSIPSITAFSSVWIDEHRAGWKPSTREQYEHVIRRWLLPAFGAIRVSELSEPRVRQFVATLVDAGLSPRRINFILLVLRMMVRAATRRKFVREDVMVGIRPLREPRTDVDPLTPEEIEAFLRECPAFWRPFFTAAFWAGARPGELFAVKWGDVDWVLGVLRIRAARYRGVEGTPKTASSVRDIDLMPPALDALRDQRAHQAASRLALGRGAADAGRDYVFTTPSGLA